MKKKPVMMTIKQRDIVRRAKRAEQERLIRKFLAENAKDPSLHQSGESK